jgi:hypothetical protein
LLKFLFGCAALHSLTLTNYGSSLASAASNTLFQIYAIILAVIPVFLVDPSTYDSITLLTVALNY